MNGRTGGEPVAYGIDFGTTNSSIAVAYRDRIEVVPVEAMGPRDILPSLIYLHRDRNRAAGQDAIEQFLINGSAKTPCSRCELVHMIGGMRDSNCRQFQPGGRCNDMRLIAGIKSDLSDTGFVSTHSWATDFTLPDLVAVVIRRLKRAADRATGANVRRVVLGHPVAFVGAEGAHYHERQE
ncbi:MAG: Hsp70 family protein, partial [Streptosporangiaceae bacterium]